MKKTISLLIVLMMILGTVLLYTGCSGSQTAELNILNWGDYIDPELIERFEQETGIHVNYTTMTSNEEMIIKLRSSDCVYDLCFPSDYILEKLIGEDLLAPLNYDNIPNAKNIGQRYYDISDAFDPGNKYSVPYMWGTVGILYNTKMVSEPVISWKILWDEKYAGQVLMYDSVRDSLAVALMMLGYDMNTRSEAEVAEARDALIRQKQERIVQAYGTDDIKTAMINGRAAMGVVYSGDAFYAMEENADLAFVVPEEGSNIWFDNAMIPKTSTHKEEAEKFINFLNDPEVARQNTEYICYSTPNDAALAIMGPEFTENETYNPGDDVRSRCKVFHDLGDFADVFNSAWEQVRLTKVN